MKFRIGQIAHQANQGIIALLQAAPHPPQQARQGIEVPIAGDHFLEDAVQRQVLVPGHWEGQRVAFPVIWERGEREAVFGFHLVTQARARQRRQKKRVEMVHAIAADCGSFRRP